MLPMPTLLHFKSAVCISFSICSFKLYSFDSHFSGEAVCELLYTHYYTLVQCLSGYWLITVQINFIFFFSDSPLLARWQFFLHISLVFIIDFIQTMYI